MKKELENEASFRFYGSLNDFLRRNKKHNWLPYWFKGGPAIKDAMEALGIPHPEVKFILVNGEPADFFALLKAQDQVEFFPDEPAIGFPIGNPLPEKPAFVLDVHLGKLAQALRLLGFDTLYQNDYTDKKIAHIAATQNRIVLTRDVGLLKQKIISSGYWLRSQHPPQQLQEVFLNFNLANICQPLTRCLTCNGLIIEVTKEQVIDQLLPKTQLYFDQFYKCPDCRRVYWKGSHYDNMVKTVTNFLPNRPVT